MVPHDTPPRCTVEAVIKEETKAKETCFYAMREVRKRTQINILLHGKGNCCVPSGHAGHLKNAVCLLDSEDDLVQLLIVLLPVVFILVFFLCLSVLESLLIFEFLTKAFFFLRRRLTLLGRLVLRH